MGEARSDSASGRLPPFVEDSQPLVVTGGMPKTRAAGLNRRSESPNVCVQQPDAPAFMPWVHKRAKGSPPS